MYLYLFYNFLRPINNVCCVSFNLVSQRIMYDLRFAVQDLNHANKNHANKIFHKASEI